MMEVEVAEENEDGFDENMSQRLDDLYHSNTFRICKTIDAYKKYEIILKKKSFSITFRVEHKDSREIFALTKFKDVVTLDRKFYRELSTRHLKHKNVLQLVGGVGGIKVEQIFLVYEYCETNLRRILDISKVPLPIPEVKCLMIQLFTGLEYLDKKSIGHLDIRPCNLLLNSQGTLKICEFRTSRLFEKEEEDASDIDANSYTALEILLRAPLCTKAADLWSAGCILGECLIASQVFPGENTKEIISNVVELIGSPNKTLMPGFDSLPGIVDVPLTCQPYNKMKRKFPAITQHCINLLNGLFVYNAKFRFTAKQCLRHAYFSESPPECHQEELVKYCTGFEDSE